MPNVARVEGLWVLVLERPFSVGELKVLWVLECYGYHGTVGPGTGGLKSAIGAGGL